MFKIQKVILKQTSYAYRNIYVVVLLISATLSTFRRVHHGALLHRSRHTHRLGRALSLF